MQLGVRDDAAAARAQVLGVKVVTNHCPKIEPSVWQSEMRRAMSC
jgi:hypothetical protein